MRRLGATVLMVLMVLPGLPALAIGEEEWRRGDPYGEIELDTHLYRLAGYPQPDWWDVQDYPDQPWLWEWSFSITCNPSDQGTPNLWMELTWTDTPAYSQRSGEVVERAGTFFNACYSSGVWFPIWEQIRPPDRTHLYLTRVQMGGTSCAVPSESYCVAWNSANDSFLGPATETMTFEDVPVEYMDLLTPFLDDVSYEYDDGNLTFDAVAGAVIATSVCTAAEDEVVRGGQSKGRRVGTVTDTQLGLQALCVMISSAVGASIPTVVEELTAPPRGQPDTAEDLPDQGNGTGTAPPLQPSPDGAGGSGNWPSTATEGSCDDGDIPDNRSNPLDMSTTHLDAGQAADLRTYARMANSWLAKNGPVTVVSTRNTKVLDPTGRTRSLYSLARQAANAARLAAQQAGTPFGDKAAGHVPDTALSGDPESPCGWLAMDSEANSLAGSYLGSRVGHIVTHLTVDGAIP